MDYSIVMPVFNREDLTKACLATLLPTLDGAGEGEVIVIDNGSRQATADVLAQFPWVKVIRNQKNLGFAAACNQGARLANGRVICHLNNDIIAQPGWLAHMLARLQPGVGIVGALLLFPNNKIQHAGVAIYPTRFGPEGIGPSHIYWGWTGDTAAAREPADFQIVTGACLLTPRELFLRYGGFDETFWNGYEDVDYCLKLSSAGLRVVYEPKAILYHYESQSGVQRKRRVSHNLRTLGNRWGSRIEPDENRYWARGGYIRRESILPEGRTLLLHPLPKTTIVVHGPAPVDHTAFVAQLTASRMQHESVVWLALGAIPRGIAGRVAGDSALGALREIFEGRHDRYIAMVDTRTRLRSGWLDELMATIEYGSEVFAATVAPSAELAVGVEPCATDARCALLNLRLVPHHIRFGDVKTVDAAVVELTAQAVRCGLGIRAIRKSIADLAPPLEDELFLQRFGAGHDDVRRPDIRRMEAACTDPVSVATLASIVMLSWNAPEYTRMAIESIRAYTHSPYEIVIIDNGSAADTLTMLRGLDDVRVIYNAKNMGFAHGCNQGIAAARGTHVVLLNNDVIVTDGWLENLLDAHRRDPLVGVSAPRSNRIVGHQAIACSYNSIEEIHALAASRSKEFAGRSYRTDRAIGFCLCISRNVIDEVGGIDTRYGVGNFEDDDFCIRVRAAGYQIVVCEDVFIHHFGSVSFKANNVDYSLQMEKNWKIFAERWGLPREYPTAGYNPLAAIRRGFDRRIDYVPLPAIASSDPVLPSAAIAQRVYDTAFVAVVDGEAAWSRIGPVVTNYIKALCVDDSAIFSIGVLGDADAATIGARIARSISKLNLVESRIADIDVADVAVLEDWLAAIPAHARLRVANDERLDILTQAPDRSPSGIVRTVRGVKR